MIEVLRLTNGKLLISAGAHCVETDADDKSMETAIDTLAERSGIARHRITVAVTRWQMADV